MQAYFGTIHMHMHMYSGMMHKAMYRYIPRARMQAHWHKHRIELRLETL